MTPREKALELFEKFDGLTHGYVGSSMLTNYEYPDAVIQNKAQCAAIVIDEFIIEGVRPLYWNDVKTELKTHADKLFNEYKNSLKHD